MKRGREGRWEEGRKRERKKVMGKEGEEIGKEGKRKGEMGRE